MTAPEAPWGDPAEAAARIIATDPALHQPQYIHACAWGRMRVAVSYFLNGASTQERLAHDLAICEAMVAQVTPAAITELVES